MWFQIVYIPFNKSDYVTLNSAMNIMNKKKKKMTHKMLQ